MPGSQKQKHPSWVFLFGSKKQVDDRMKTLSIQRNLVKAHSTQELIEYLEQKNYTDIIFDFDETICHLKINWSSWFDDINQIAQSFDNNPVDYALTLHEEMEKLIEKHGEPARKKINQAFLDCERNHLDGVHDNEPLIDFIRENASHTMHILSSNMT